MIVKKYNIKLIYYSLYLYGECIDGNCDNVE